MQLNSKGSDRFLQPSILFGLMIFLLVSCSVPKVMNQSGRVTPVGNISGGVTYAANVSQVATVHLDGALRKYITEYPTADTVDFNKMLLDANKALVAYSLDPIAAGPQFYFNIGIFDRLEIGYLRTEASNALSSRLQFLGYENKRIPESKVRWFGSVGVQYSWNKYSLPDYFGQLQETFGYRYGRRDFLIPLNFSYSFGPNEKYGALGIGAVLGMHHVYYSFIPENVINDQGELLKPVDYKENYQSLGFFLNLKLGYKYAYIIPSLAVYHQNYGAYPMLDRSMVGYKGFTFVPAITLQLNTIHDFSWKEFLNRD
jgi:hypothetical protein